MKTIPQVPSYSLLGHISSYVANPLAFLENKWKGYGDIFKFRVANRNLTVIHHPDYIKHVLQENHSNYQKNLAYRKLKALLGNGLFTSEGDYWLKQRRLAQPAFHKERLASYINCIVRYTEAMLERWELKAQKNEVVCINKEMTNLTLQIISKTLLGLDLSAEGKIVEEHLPFALSFMLKRITNPLNAPLSWPLPSHNKFHHAVHKLNSLIEELIETKRNSTDLQMDLLSSLIEIRDADTGEGMSDQQLRDEVITFFLAGHETSAIGLTWTIQQILSEKAVNEKLQTEVESCSIDSFSMESLKKLDYTKQVIQESMRLIPPVWIMGREALGEDQLGSYSIKNGDSIIFSPYIVHRHPEFWNNPNQFDPDRFSPDNEKRINKFAYFPFGGGPRLCIGQSFAMLEMQIILTMMFQRFNLSKLSAQPGYSFSLTLRPSEDIYLKIEERVGCNV